MVLQIEKVEGAERYGRLMEIRRKYGSQKFPTPIERSEEERKRDMMIQEKRDAAAIKRDLERGSITRGKIIIDTYIPTKKEKNEIKNRMKARAEEAMKKKIEKNQRKSRKRKSKKSAPRKNKERKLNVQYKIGGVYFHQTDKVYNSKISANNDAKEIRKHNNRARVVTWKANGKTEFYIYTRKGKKD